MLPSLPRSTAPFGNHPLGPQAFKKKAEARFEPWGPSPPLLWRDVEKAANAAKATKTT
jgi:hypothetical protein